MEITKGPDGFYRGPDGRIMAKWAAEKAYAKLDAQNTPPAQKATDALLGNERAQKLGIRKNGNNYVDANGRRIGFSDYSWYGLS